MDQNKSGSIDEDPVIVRCKREENDSDYFESVDAPSASRSRSRPSDGNSRARKRPGKVKSLPRSRRMTSDLEIGEIGLFRIFKGFFSKKKKNLPQNSKIFKILWVRLGNLILSLTTK